MEEVERAMYMGQDVLEEMVVQAEDGPIRGYDTILPTFIYV